VSATAVGVLGGTFDPVHEGHLALARAAMDALPLERMLLLPCAVPPHKHPPRLTEARHRRAMLELAVAGRSDLEVCEVELARGGVSYTIDTLRELRHLWPQRIPVFVMGMDSLLDLPTWKEFRALMAQFTLAVVDRDERGERERSRSLHAEVAALLRPASASSRPAPAALARGGVIYHVRMPPVDASSRAIRALASRGQGLAGLVPPAVARYIRAQRLYEEEPT